MQNKRNLLDPRFIDQNIQNQTNPNYANSYAALSSISNQSKPVLTIRFSGSGVPIELIEDPILGLVRMNRWPAELRGQIRFLQMVTSSEEDGQNVPSNHRVIRFEAQQEVVKRILEKDGAIYIGKDKGTVYYKSKPLTKGTSISYKLQK